MRLVRHPGSAWRRPPSPSPAPGLAALLLAAWIASDPAAASERFVAQTAIEGDRDVVLLAAPDGTWVERGAARERIELPQSAWLNRITALDGGWVAGGARATGGGQDLVLIAGGAGESWTIELPFEPTSRIRQSAVPLVLDGTLAGVAWLEGDDFSSLAVRCARLGDQGWGAAETVSPPAPGGQVALSGAVLADGSWLLVWSRYDGEDTETVWSRSAARDEWTPVALVHEPNDVPDVTPTLIATRSGALVAWSAYDGHTLRLRLSRLDGDGWRDTGYRGPAAAVYPTFVPALDGPWLLFKTVVPYGWSVMQVDDSGRELRRATVGAARRERPLVRAVAAGADNPAAVRFLWPSLDAEGADVELAAEWEAPQ